MCSEVRIGLVVSQLSVHAPISARISTEQFGEMKRKKMRTIRKFTFLLTLFNRLLLEPLCAIKDKCIPLGRMTLSHCELFFIVCRKQRYQSDTMQGVCFSLTPLKSGKRLSMDSNNKTYRK